MIDFTKKLDYNVCVMENTREIISKNLIQLRKSHNLTQVELAKKLNYSDKAISRWEKGEVVPDIETIYMLSEIYDVPVSRILEKQDEDDGNTKASTVKQRVLSQIFLTCEIWLILCVAFAYINMTQQISVWQIFVWGVPATAVVLIIFNRKQHNNILNFVCGTIFVWSLIICIYLLLIKENPWYTFFVGIPLQGLLIVRYIFDYKQGIIHLKNKKTKKERKS